MGFILSLDQGTTGTTAVLIDAETFQFVGKVNKEYPQIYPQPGWVEHNLSDIWKTVEETTLEVLQKNNASANDIQCIGITNQRETTCAFSKDGTPLANAIVWQDRRTADFCQSLKDREESLRTKTGLPIDPYFSATKMRWLLKNNDRVMKASDKGNLLFGNIDTYLLYRLSGGTSFATEASNASRTYLMNLESCDWDDELLSTFEVKRESLPEIKDSFGEFGKTSGLSFLPDGIPITGILGDQQAALFGQAGFNKGDMKCTYGTGAFILLNTGTEINRSKSGLLSTVAYKDNGKTYYALEGSCYIAGAAVQWLRDNLNIIENSPAIENLSKEVTNLKEMEHLLFLPFFTGIGSPYWEAEAKGAIIGLTRDTGKAHLAKACLDGIALSIEDLVSAMRKDTGLEIPSLKVDGGAVANNLLMETQATISKLNIIRPKVIETTAYGAALAAAIGNKMICLDKIRELWREDQSFSPNTNNEEFYQAKKKQWDLAIKRLFL